MTIRKILSNFKINNNQPIKRHAVTGCLFLIKSIGFCLVGFYAFVPIYAQEVTLDSLYREDQIFVTIQYNALRQTPNNFQQNKLSHSLEVGFLRDFPINTQRNWAVAAGLGYGFHRYFTNFRIQYENDVFVGETMGNNIDYNNNRWTTHSLSLPLQLRWRTSTASTTKFWRIYGGLTFSYLFSRTSFFENGTTTERISKIPIQPWQSGLSLVAGNNTWNVSLYYALKPFFESKAFYQKDVQANELRVGLAFYIF